MGTPKGRTLHVGKLLEFINSLYISGEDEDDLNAIEALHKAGLTSIEIINGFKNANAIADIDINQIIGFINEFEANKPILEALSNVDDLGLTPAEIANAIFKAHSIVGEPLIPDNALVLTINGIETYITDNDGNYIVTI